MTYLDVDVLRIDLIQDGGYIRPAKAESPRGKALSISVPVREGPIVHGISFVSNRILHSGRDNADGHFVAAYGFEFPNSPDMGGNGN